MFNLRSSTVVAAVESNEELCCTRVDLLELLRRRANSATNFYLYLLHCILCVCCNFSFFTVLVCPLLVQVAVLSRCRHGQREPTLAVKETGSNK